MGDLAEADNWERRSGTAEVHVQDWLCEKRRSRTAVGRRSGSLTGGAVTPFDVPQWSWPAAVRPAWMPDQDPNMRVRPL